MIKVRRGNEPDGFNEQSEKWLQEFQQACEIDPKLTPHAFWSLVRRRKAMQAYAKQLSEVFNHKCAFCESRMEHVSPAQVEHYLPKNRTEFQDRMFAWDNWLLACASCNTNKGTYFDYCDEQPCLIDPSSENPSEHLSFLGAQILYQTTRGKTTIEQIRLDRVALDETRALWLNRIQTWVLQLLNQPTRDEARKALIWAMQDDAPYAAMTRAFLQSKTPRLANPPNPHPNIQIDEVLEGMETLLMPYEEVLSVIS